MDRRRLPTLISQNEVNFVDFYILPCNNPQAMLKSYGPKETKLHLCIALSVSLETLGLVGILRVYAASHIRKGINSNQEHIYAEEWLEASSSP